MVCLLSNTLGAQMDSMHESAISLPSVGSVVSGLMNHCSHPGFF